MKKTENTQPDPAENKKTAKKHAADEGLGEEVYAGLKARMGWRDGREVSLEEFLKAVKDFLDAPADGREAKTNGRR